MSTLTKSLDRFNKRPIPNDITFAEVEQLARYFGCQIIQGGKHTKVAHKESGTIIPIPRHGKYVGEAYVKQLKQLFEVIQSEE